MRDRGNS